MGDGSLFGWPNMELLLTHLFFADDLLLFVEASIDQAYVVDAVLDNFVGALKQK